MTPAVLVVIDDDRDVLAGLEAQLVKRYADDYRVECLGDPERALARLAELAREGEGELALRKSAGGEERTSPPTRCSC